MLRLCLRTQAYIYSSYPSSRIDLMVGWISVSDNGDGNEREALSFIVYRGVAEEEREYGS